MPEFENILVERDGAVGIITLNRPKVLNALNAALLREVSEALAKLERDEAVRAVVVTGSGEKAFAAGADIGELNALQNAGAGADKARSGQRVTRQMERLRKPVIVAVNGFALGGGCELAMGGDIMIASENAKFGQPEVNLGLIPGFGGSQRTTRLVGKGMAAYLCLTGETIDAAEALRIGLVQRVVPLANLLDEAKRIANMIASKAPLAIASCKRVINNGAHLSIDDALELEAIEFGTLVDTNDFREGTGAFLEKRKPNWTAS
ncbi:MAG: enoyl-CoA hydratase/isomerase family protein [Candidatus Eremiobacteraeota bacterium]|nr:enoyl-CoA hydratase/isomerase family protein [Candidatus Eremiobacteraeota bacterium]